MKNGHFDERGTLASLALPKFFFKFFGYHICERAWFWLRVAPPPAFVSPIVAEKNVSIGHKIKKDREKTFVETQQQRHTFPLQKQGNVITGKR